MNFWLRRAGAGKLNLDDLTAAAAAEVVIEEAEEAKADIEPEAGIERFGEEFWETARARASEQGSVPQQVLEALCGEYDIQLDRDFATYFELARVVGAPIRLQ